MTYYILSAWLREHVAATSLIILFSSVCPRVFLAARAPNQAELITTIPDAGTYIVPAQNLVERGAFLNRHGEPEISRTPGYPVFLAAIMLLCDQDWQDILVSQAIVLSLTVLGLYLLARQLLPPVMAFIGGLLAAFSPWGAYLASVPLTEGLFLLLLVLVLGVLRLIEEARHPLTAGLGSIFLGLCTGATVLVRPIWQLVIPFAVAVFIRLRKTREGVWALVVIMSVCASTPIALWKERNNRLRNFDGLSDIGGITARQYLAARVTAQVDGRDRFTVHTAFELEEDNWKWKSLSLSESDSERWRRARTVFREYPLLTIYCFVLSAVEHMVHPSPNVLAPARLNFDGDYFALAVLWGGLTMLAGIGWFCKTDAEWDDGEIDRSWLRTIFVICLVITLSSGMSFGQGARLRAPLELIVPLLAAVGLVRLSRGALATASTFKHLLLKGQGIA